MKKEQAKAKALFFAQYLGQEIMHHIDVQDVSLPPEYALVNDEVGKPIWNIADSYLLLRSVSQLTNKEFTKIGCSVGWGVSEENKEIVLPLVKKDLKNNMHKYGIYKDLLRLYGVLVDFTYLNEENKTVTLQPDEIISLGWAKYQTI